MNQFIKEHLLTIIVVAITFGGVIFFSVVPVPSQSISSGIVAIISAMIGVLLTVVVTKSLLNKQSENEASKDKSIKIFEEKLKIYQTFLHQLHNIIKDNKITEEEVKELIFQVSYLAMHTKSEYVESVLQELQYTVSELNKEKINYDTLAQKILNIVLQLQKELYGDDLGVIDTRVFSSLVTEIEEAANIETSQGVDQCGIALTKEAKAETQIMFWYLLIESLRKINPLYNDPIFTERSIKINVTKYYDKARNRHRYYGFSFEIYTTKSGRKVLFAVELENDYYYGFRYKTDKSSYKHTDGELKQVVKSISSEYRSNDSWAGWRWPKANDLNFWKFTPEANMARFTDPVQRVAMVSEIAEEMAAEISSFITEAKWQNL